MYDIFELPKKPSMGFPCSLYTKILIGTVSFRELPFLYRACLELDHWRNQVNLVDIKFNYYVFAHN